MVNYGAYMTPLYADYWTKEKMFGIESSDFKYYVVPHKNYHISYQLN